MSGTWVLDSEGLSAYLRADKEMTSLIGVAHEEDIRVVVAAVTIVEADHEGVHPARMDWVLSRLDVIPVTKDSARSASGLLKTAGLHGHKYAIDSIVAATALDVPDKPASVMTSDADDISVLLGERLDCGGAGRPADPSRVRVLPV